eukprot:Rhum_TRINITY_DN11147_c1_g1::Rhum_TRINITY_DN11147_c1_g1_i1::g.42657::m.42657
MIEEKPGNAKVVEAARELQRSAALNPSPSVQSSATLQQKPDNLCVAPLAREVKRGQTNANHARVDRGATVKQEPGNLELVTLTSVVERTVSDSSAGHTRIEVQSTPTHVTGNCRVAKSPGVDLPTLLTQRGGSERCHRRRKLHNTA